MAEEETQIEKRAAGTTTETKPDSATIKGKIVEYLWWMKENGLRESTIKARVKRLAELAGKVNILDPKCVKRFIATQNWKESTKRGTVTIFSSFFEFLKVCWEAPKYQIIESLPFIPLEQEIDQLIACVGKKISTFLQGLKETGADPGELIRVQWIDINIQSRKIAINYPVKGHNPRILPISDKFVNMLQALPKKSDRLFGQIDTQGMYADYHPQRKHAAVKLANPRLQRIAFITLRHWKGTMEYHKTKDIMHVKQLLGHKNIQSTMIYINLEQAYFNPQESEFTVKVAKTPEEAGRLAEVGFEKFDQFDALHLYRKRK